MTSVPTLAAFPPLPTLSATSRFVGQIVKVLLQLPWERTLCPPPPGSPYCVVQPRLPYIVTPSTGSREGRRKCTTDQSLAPPPRTQVNHGLLKSCMPASLQTPWSKGISRAICLASSSPKHKPHPQGLYSSPS